ncbi:hypothetical protein Pmar_PMAR027822 [Perkinsus marinus ATCC 50983]|uniref:Uncharacterized protein n=1 Tax=Perkinsus marinus (strain ATCC 50983 / TXsc) TaxID=423536 RepID=C5K4B8_PERM5|nr:hypothetical protein Pmar_PMAR027822 [Perkinsus marinus ATCC 50983]EER20674.1 hypothetical protein Pmar_PMAR027822 [Perkinsus marinus ATCC 50983]|eukprot:XP_002788878.1 hypothetical protein Pmar_PMAR027822 [Perkinsus marinus ATCC 50983]
MRQWLSTVPVVLGHVRGAGNPSDCASRALYPNSYDSGLYRAAISTYVKEFDGMRERLVSPNADDDLGNGSLDAMMLNAKDGPVENVEDSNVVSVEEQVLTAQTNDQYCEQIRRVLAHEPVELSTSEAQRIRRTYVVDSGAYL